MHNAPETSKRLIAIFGLVAIVAVIGGAAALRNMGDDNQVAVTSTATPTTATDNSGQTAGSATSANSAYQNGSFSATGTYKSPAGAESITVNITLKDSVIANTTATAQTTDSTSRMYQNEFLNGYKSMVVGKNIDEVSLSKVSGSSLTSAGFNDALSQIKTKAKG